MAAQPAAAGREIPPGWARKRNTLPPSMQSPVAGCCAVLLGYAAWQADSGFGSASAELGHASTATGTVDDFSRGWCMVGRATSDIDWLWRKEVRLFAHRVWLVVRFGIPAGTSARCACVTWCRFMQGQGVKRYVAGPGRRRKRNTRRLWCTRCRKVQEEYERLE